MIEGACFDLDAAPPAQETMNISEAEIAVLIPCFNEASTIAHVIEDFQKHLPDAKVYVYDNNSTDGTAAAAQASGAVVRSEPLQGKGNVVRRMFADVEADIYVLVDGDGTYDPGSAPRMIEELARQRCDMISGKRITDIKQAYRPGHRFGNKFLTRIVGDIFGNRFDDILSGYRVLSRRFVKSFPALSSGFEIETELSVHALELRMPCLEMDTSYKERPQGSASKLNTFRDGFRILHTIVSLVREERPLFFFGVLFLLLAAASIGLFIPILLEYLDTGLVPRFPTAILSASIMLLAFLCLFSGLILKTVTKGRVELKRLQYLSMPWSRQRH